MASKKRIPNSKRAITNAKIATYHNGQRIVRKYNSGDPLIGSLEEDTIPYTGYVRGFGKKKKK